MKFLSKLFLRDLLFSRTTYGKRAFFCVRTILQDLHRSDVLRQASAMAYVTLLSLVPSLVAVFCVISLFSPLMVHTSSLEEKIRQFILTNLATGSGEAVVAYLDRMLRDLDLAKIGLSSFASVLFSLILLLKQIEGALNKIWLIRNSRNLFTRFMYFWSFLTLGLLVLGVGVGVSSGFKIDHILTLQQVEKSKHYFHGVWSLGGSFIFFFALFKVVPNCKVRNWSAAGGSLIAAILLQQAGRIYGVYIKDVKNYQTLYGALAQLPLFLTWLYICWVVILLGALISWRLQEGFPKSEEDENFFAKTPLEAWRNTQIRCVLPVLVLLAIYKKFSTGKGEGLKLYEVAHRFNIPQSWVAEALDVLTGLNYVIVSKKDVHSIIAVEEEAYFPSHDANVLSLEAVRQDFYRSISETIQIWHQSWPLDLKNVLTSILIPHENNGAQEPHTLSHLIENIPLF